MPQRNVLGMRDSGMGLFSQEVTPYDRFQDESKSLVPLSREDQQSWLRLDHGAHSSLNASSITAHLIQGCRDTSRLFEEAQGMRQECNGENMLTHRSRKVRINKCFTLRHRAIRPHNKVAFDNIIHRQVILE